MYKPGKALSSLISGEDTNRRTNIIGVLEGIVAAAGVGALISSCAGLKPKPDFYPQKGMPNTMTYIDPKTKEEKVVYDLSGKWEALYYGNKEIVEIKQEGNYFEGVKTIGTTIVGQGAKTIRGTIEGNLIDCATYNKTKGWQGVSRKISKDCNSFQCWGEELRTFKRLTK